MPDILTTHIHLTEAEEKGNLSKFIILVNLTLESMPITLSYATKRASLVDHLVKNAPAMQETLVRFLGQEGSLSKGQSMHSSIVGLPGGSGHKESACIVGNLGSISGLGQTPRRGHGNLLQYPCLENPHEQRSLAGYSPWGLKEPDITEQLSTAQLVANNRLTK